MDARQEAKLDTLLGLTNQLIPQVRDTKEAVQHLERDVSELKVTNAKQNERITSNGTHIDNIGKKVREHVSISSIHTQRSDGFSEATTRWRFLGAVVVGLSSLVGLITIFAGYFNP